MLSPFLICMHLLRVIKRARSALNFKSPPFFQHFFSSSFVAEIGGWLSYSSVEKTGEYNVFFNTMVFQNFCYSLVTFSGKVNRQIGIMKNIEP